MTDAGLAELDLEALTQSEKALKLVQDMAAGRHTGAERLARYIVDREEGKTPERHIVGEAQSLTDIMALVGLNSGDKAIEGRHKLGPGVK